MNKQEKKRRAQEEARRTMDLLEQQPRPEADPWLAERTIARLQREPEHRSSGSFQWALTILLLALNSTALYVGINSELQQADLGQVLDEEYELSATTSDPYDFTTNTDDDEFYQSN